MIAINHPLHNLLKSTLLIRHTKTRKSFTLDILPQNLVHTRKKMGKKYKKYLNKIETFVLPSLSNL